MVAGSSRRSAAFFVRAFDAAISGLPGLGKKAIGLATRRFNQILTQNIRHSKPGTVIDVVTCRPCEQGVSDGFFRALLCRPHRRGIFGRDRYRDLDVDALSRAPSRRRSGTAEEKDRRSRMERRPKFREETRQGGPSRRCTFRTSRGRRIRFSTASRTTSIEGRNLPVVPESAKAYPGQSSPAMYAARRSSAALA
jgi:hypothetical protein